MLPSLSFISFLLGLIFGSFIAAYTYRRIRKENFISEKSACPKCGHSLSWKDLIPILSYIFLKGECRYCKRKISLRYPLIELTTGLFFLINSFFPLPLREIIVLDILSLLFISIIVTDLESKIIPDELIFFSFIISLWLTPNILMGLLRGIIIFSIGFLIRYIFLKVKKTESLGMGDIKLFFVSGMLLDFNSWPMFFILSGGFGICLSFILKSKRIPFAPAIIISLILCILYHTNVHLEAH